MCGVPLNITHHYKNIKIMLVNLGTKAKQEMWSYKEFEDLVRGVTFKTKAQIKSLLNLDVNSVLTESAKTEKSAKNAGIENYVLYLLPATSAGLKKSLCPFADNCVDPCLVNSGYQKLENHALEAGSIAYSPVHNKRLKLTWLYHANKSLFEDIVASSMEYHVKRAQKAGNDIAIRLNGTSDIPAKQLESLHATACVLGAHAYEYTKNHLDMDGKYAYRVFSYDGATNRKNHLNAVEFLKVGKGLAVCFDEDSFNEFEESWNAGEKLSVNGVRIINGDLFDTRHIDRQYFGLSDNEPYIVALKYKVTSNVSAKDAHKQPFVCDIDDILGLTNEAGLKFGNNGNIN